MSTGVLFSEIRSLLASGLGVRSRRRDESLLGYGEVWQRRPGAQDAAKSEQLISGTGC